MQPYCLKPRPFLRPSLAFKQDFTFSLFISLQFIHIFFFASYFLFCSVNLSLLPSPCVCVCEGFYFSGNIEGTEGHTDALQMLYQMNSLKFLSGIHSLGRLSPLTPSVHVQTKTLQVLELCSVQEASFTMFKLLQLKIFIRLKFCLD